MLIRFLPKQEQFFELFNQLCSKLVDSAQALLTIFSDPDSLSEAPERVTRIKQEAKTKTQQLFTLTHRTFITPFDRNDIHQLNSEIYDAINTINLTVQRHEHYQIHDIPTPMRKLASICTDASKLVAEVVNRLSNLKNHFAIIDICQQIKAHESAADQLLMLGIAELYREEDDIKLILKLKEIYGLLESITDRYQQIAYIIEGIVLEYA